MQKNYRATLRDNLLRCLDGGSPKIAPTYLGGPKAGKKMAPRSVQSYLEDDGASPSLDALAAIAAYFKLEVWHLLIPGLNPKEPPTVLVSAEEKRVYRQLLDMLTLARGSLDEAEDAQGTGGRGDHGATDRGMPESRPKRRTR